MKQVVLVGTLVSALAATGAFAQGRAGGAAGQAGHTAPKAQPETAPPPSVPAGEMQLGSVHLPGREVDGKALPAGTPLCPDGATATPAAAGQTAAERWVN
jgi:hypothetical protein